VPGEKRLTLIERLGVLSEDKERQPEATGNIWGQGLHGPDSGEFYLPDGELADKALRLAVARKVIPTCSRHHRQTCSKWSSVIGVAISRRGVGRIFHDGGGSNFR